MKSCQKQGPKPAGEKKKRVTFDVALGDKGLVDEPRPSSYRNNLEHRVQIYHDEIHEAELLRSLAGFLKSRKNFYIAIALFLIVGYFLAWLKAISC